MPKKLNVTAPTTTVRMDAETREKISEYMDRHEISSQSQAIRVLLAVALRDQDQSIGDAFETASFKEGVIKGVSAIRARLRDAMDSALGDLE